VFSTAGSDCIRLTKIQDAAVPHQEWVSKYGPTIVYNAQLGVRRNTISALASIANSEPQMKRFYTVDLKAVNHILMNSNTYQKPEATRFFLSEILGDGMISMRVWC